MELLKGNIGRCTIADVVVVVVPNLVIVIGINTVMMQVVQLAIVVIVATGVGRPMSVAT